MPRAPLLLLALLTVAAHTGEVSLSANKQPALTIVLSADASPALKKTAADFAKVLGQLAGTEFKIETGDGLSGIALGTAANFPNVSLAEKFSNSPFERETYILRSHDKGLQLIGASDLAVSHAAWDLLHRLGHRQYFPGATWEVLPPARDLSISIDVRERPAFAARRIWYNWGLWGYNNQPYDEWCTRNRMVKGFDLQSGHAYDNIFASNKAEFEKHPEYLALVNGQRRTSGGDIKFCVSNAGLRKLVADYAVAQVQKNPQLDSVSMDPSDGDNWCECDECKKMGSVSNRVVTLANEVAVAINAFAKEKNLGEKYVGTYAYNKHSAPPTVKVDPHVIISATTAFIGGGFTFDQVVSGWKAQGATVGVYDYLSVVDWDWNLPRGSSGSRPAHVAAGLKKFHSMGARFYDAESGDCWGPCGLGYYTASRVLWNVADAENVASITEEFLSNCFGPAKEPMREFYRLINFDNQRRSPSDLTGRMYRQLDAARKLTDDPKIRERLDHLILYTRHAELYSAFANAAGSRDDVVRHDYRIRKTMMVHSYGLWSRLLTQRDALTEKHPLKDDRPFSADEIAKILTEGIAKNQPVETGFASVEFSKKLVPAAEKLNLAPVPAGRFPDAPQDYQQYHLWMKNAGTLELQIAVQKVWANRAPKLSLYSPLEVTLDPVTVDETYKPNGKVTTLKLKTPHAGLHKIITLDGGDHTRIQWPTGLPVSIESGIDTPQVTSHFRGGWTLYFYVPKGTKLIGGWASRIANWAPKISGTLVDPTGKVAIDFAKLEDGWFKTEVPEGTDGKLWKFENALGQRLLMTVPPYLARSAEELLLPEEVVEKDAQ